jgi:hypothetical protein
MDLIISLIGSAALICGALAKLIKQKEPESK